MIHGSVRANTSAIQLHNERKSTWTWLEIGQVQFSVQPARLLVISRLDAYDSLEF